MPHGTKVHAALCGICLYAVGVGPLSNKASATLITAPTAAVADLSATAGDGQVTLGWTAPASIEATAPIASWEYGFKLAGGTSYSWDAIPSSSSTTTSYTVTGLTNGNTYRFKIRAKNAVGVGPLSNKASATLITAPTAAVADLSATAGDGQVTLGWTAPTSTEATAPIASWEYGFKLAGGTSYSWDAIPSSSSTTTSYTVTGLTNGNTYRFKIRAKNAVGVGPLSNKASATPATVPDAVGSLSATPGDGQVVVSWAAPASDGGSSITGYEYQYSPGGSGWTAVADVTVTVSGLANGTQYTFEVRAVNGVGQSTESSISATPATVPGAVSNLSTTASDGQVVLAWDAPASDGGSAITGYEYQYSPGGSGWTAVTGVTVTVSGLTNGTAYTFEVRAVNGVGQGTASSMSATPVTVPDAVGSLSATAGDGQVTLGWDAPADDGGSAITGYEYQYSPGGSGWTAVAGVTVTVSGLTNGTAYTFEVRAVNGVGQGPASSTSATPVAPATVPGAVENLSAKPGNGQVVLSWDAPLSDGGAPIAKYQYGRSGGSWQDVPGGADARTVTVSGLTNGTEYGFTVVAVNSVGEGPLRVRWATPDTVVVPDMVANLSATAGDGQVVLGWDAPADDGGSAITGYEYQHSPGGSGWAVVDGGASTRTVTVSGLTNGTAYTFEVRAVNGVGKGPASSTSATPVGAPAAVANLSATAGAGQVTLSWQVPSSDGGSAITGYEYQYSPGGSGWTAVADITVTVIGLTNTTEYTFEVRAVNGLGQGPASSASATPVGAPAAVANLSAAAGNGQVTLGWDAPASDGGSAITGYEYQYSPGGSGWTAVDGGVSARRVAVSGLTNGTQYTFEVRAVNGLGQGPASSASATPNSSATEPGAVENLLAEAGDGQVVLSWDAPLSDGGSPITQYQYISHGDTLGVVAGGADTRSVTVSGLTNGTEYGFAVYAVNSVGAGPLRVRWITLPPGAVENLSATAGNGQVTLRWAAPASNGDVPITQYQYSSDRGANWLDVSGGGNARSYTVPNLTNGTAYTFAVRAVNSAGEGPASSVSATPTTRVPGKVASLSASAGNRQVTLSWKPPTSNGGAAITKYQYRRGSGTWQDVSGGAAARRVTVSGLTNGTTYTFSVRAVNRAGEGTASSASATPATVPGAVGSLSATPGDGQVTLAWTAPADDGGPAITGYQYQYRPSGNGWTAVAGTTVTVSGLTNGTEYTFEVRARNGVGQGAARSTTATPATVPGAVENLSASAGDGSVTLRWAAPADDGGSAVTEYQYQYSPGGSGWTAVADVTVTVSGLTNGTEYTFKVRARNSMGEGPASSVSATPESVLCAVENLSATPGNGQVELSWTAPASNDCAAITGYEYQYRPGGSGWTAVAGTTVTVSGLTNGTEYTFKVRVRNSAGEGPASSVSATPATVPGAVENLSATPGNGQVELSWTAPASNGGSPITGYEYQYSPGGSGWTAVAGTTVTVSGLTNGTEYTFKVRARNSAGEGPESSESATPATVPDAVENLSASAGDGSVTLRWDAPLSDGGSPITEYQYQRSGGSWTIVLGGASARSKTVAGLNNGTTYTFYVRAVNDAGAGSSSSVTGTPVSSPDPPDPDPDPDPDPQCSDGTVSVSPSNPKVGDTLTATLTDPDNPTGMSWRWKGSISGGSGSSSTYTVQPSDEGNSVSVSVSYSDDCGSQQSADGLSDTVTRRHRPCTLSLSASPGGTSVYLSWSTSGDCDPISGYNVSCGGSSTFVTGTSKTETGLARCSSPSCSVQAVYEAGGTGPSDSKTVKLNSPGSVSLTTTSPVVGDPVTATLTDLDGGITGASWSWSSFSWALSASAASSSYPELSSYTPSSSDVGESLKATVSYRDNCSPNNIIDSQASSSWTSPVTAASGKAVSLEAMADSVLAAIAAPNPFNPTTTLHVHLPASGPVSLTIYNMAGQVVRTLWDHRELEAGYHTIDWDSRDQQGQPVTSGVYLYRLQAGTQTVVDKMLLLR